MKLDRNTNRGGRGKYALVNMRKLIPLIEQREAGTISSGDKMILESFEDMVETGIVSLGNESPGDQFFVMKYKDKFTAPALDAYSDAVYEHAEATNDAGLREFADQMFHEAQTAYDLGVRIPD